jgi:Protein of unknown function (DUF1573)
MKIRQEARSKEQGARKQVKGDYTSMKNVKLIMVIALALVFLGADAGKESGSAKAEEGEGVPVIAVDSDAFSFPEVEAGTKIDAAFNVRNEGGALLKIDQITATCDCTTACEKKFEIAPGKTKKLVITLDTSYRVGDLDKSVILKTNDPKTPELTLHIKGKTFEPLTFKPAPLFFDRLIPGVEQIADVTLMNTGKKTVTVKAITASEADLSFEISGKGDSVVTLPLTLPVGDYIWVRLKIKAARPAGKAFVMRQIAVTAEPTPVTPMILKIQGLFVKE